MNNNEQTLLANARQSVKDEQKARRKQQRERLLAFWDDCHDDLENFARECIPDYYATDSTLDPLENVRRRLFRCTATTKEGFLSWASKMIAKEPHFHLTAKAIQNFDLDVSNWIADAALKLTRYVNFPEHVKEGDLYRVKMGESAGVPIVWTVPERLWGFVQRAYPLTLKQRRNGSYWIAKQVSGLTIPAHRLVTDCGPQDTVLSTSGNLLDWTSLYVRPLNQSGIYEGRNTSWNSDADRPNTAQEHFESRFKSAKVLANYGCQDGEYWSLSTPVPVNTLASTTTCWGKVTKTGWGKSAAVERDYSYAPEGYERPTPSARMLRAAEALTALGL